MTLTEKTKQYLAIGGGVLVCMALVAAISLQFQKVPTKEDTVPESSQQMTDIVADPSGLADNRDEEEQAGEKATEKTETGDTEMVINPNVSAEDTEQAVDARPAQTDQTEQSIQPEPTKPEAPNEETLKDQTVKPDGTKVEGEPEAVEHDAVEKPAETVAPAGTPQAGDTSGNQIYVPGFGWVENHGGGGSGTVAEDMYENGNKIGIMD